MHVGTSYVDLAFACLQVLIAREAETRVLHITIKRTDNIFQQCGAWPTLR